ncbi:ADP-ribose pyrophosphatase [Pedobacter sp. UYP30]|uniref:NUDIX hydrolase n=1 Tax=Pedobacter sp. UYP30 TaxID=1756400 RepID=UPI00339AA703
MVIEKWKKLATKYLVKEKWATLRVDTVELQGGAIKDDYYVLEYPNWVNAIAITEEGKIILVRQYRHAADIVSLEVPGGVIDGDELPEFAIKRELKEETGYTFKTCKLVAELYPNPATSNNKTFTYLLTGGVKTDKQHLDEHEILNLEEYTVEEIKDLIKEHKIAQALHVAALWYGLEALGDVGGQKSALSD